MSGHRRDETDIRLAEADADWLTEIARIYGVERVDAVAATPEDQGEPALVLRGAYDVRQAAYADWRAAHELT